MVAYTRLCCPPVEVTPSATFRHCLGRRPPTFLFARCFGSESAKGCRSAGRCKVLGGRETSETCPTRASPHRFVDRDGSRAAPGVPGPAPSLPYSQGMIIHSRLLWSSRLRSKNHICLHRLIPEIRLGVRGPGGRSQSFHSCLGPISLQLSWRQM